jgi:hypothetical protein
VRADNINTLSLSELQSLSPRLHLDLPDYAQTSQKKSIAYHELMARLDTFRAETRMCFFMVESSLQVSEPADRPAPASPALCVCATFPLPHFRALLCASLCAAALPPRFYLSGRLSRPA